MSKFLTQPGAPDDPSRPALGCFNRREDWGPQWIGSAFCLFNPQALMPWLQSPKAPECSNLWAFAPAISFPWNALPSSSSHLPTPSHLSDLDLGASFCRKPPSPPWWPLLWNMPFYSGNQQLSRTQVQDSRGPRGSQSGKTIREGGFAPLSILCSELWVSGQTNEFPIRPQILTVVFLPYNMLSVFLF